MTPNLAAIKERTAAPRRHPWPLTETSRAVIEQDVPALVDYAERLHAELREHCIVTGRMGRTTERCGYCAQCSGEWLGDVEFHRIVDGEPCLAAPVDGAA